MSLKDRANRFSNTSTDLLQALITPSQEILPKRLLGPLFTLVLVAIVELLVNTKLRVALPFPLLFLSIALSGSLGGLRSALNSAFLTWLYAAYYFSLPGNLLRFDDEGLRNFITISFSAPLTAVITGTLKHHSELLTLEKVEHAKAEAKTRALSHIATQYRLLFEKNPNPMWIVDENTLYFLAVNEATTRLYGYSKEEFLTQRLVDIRPPEDIPRLLRYMKKVRSQKIKELFFGGTWKHVTKEGKLIDIESISSSIVFNGRRAVLTMIKDVTQQKQIESLKNEFLTVAGHELKTPLTSAKLLAQTLAHKLRKARVEKETVRLSSRIDFELDRLTRLLNDILDISRIETGKLQLNLVEINLAVVIKNATSTISTTIADHKIIFLDKQNVTVIADSDHIEQVLINLVANAAKYSPPNTTITIKVQKQPTRALVSVTDQGVGIPKDKQAKIFDRFYQVEGTPKEGFGLGLYISKEIIEKHRGKIWVESEVGKGSTFFFTLPIPNVVKN